MSLTYKNKVVARLRQHGFRKKMSTVSGRALIQRRRRKGRHKLTVSDKD